MIRLHQTVPTGKQHTSGMEAEEPLPEVVLKRESVSARDLTGETPERFRAPAEENHATPAAGGWLTSERSATGRDALPQPPRRALLLVALLAVAVIGLIFGGYELLERRVLASRIDMQMLHVFHILRGVISSLVLAGVIAWFLLRHPAAVFPSPQSAAGLPTLLDREGRRRQHVRWFVQMRWIATAVSLALILIAVPITHILSRSVLVPLLTWWTTLPLANLLFSRWARKSRRFDLQISAQVIVDLVILSGLLNASGGIENPLYTAYLFHVIIAGILLPKQRALGLTVAAGLLFAVVVFGEYFRLLPHYTNLLFPHPHSSQGVSHAAHDSVFVLGRSLPFLIVLLLTAYLTTLVAERLRQSERELEAAARASLLERQRLESVIDAAGVGMMLLSPDLSILWYSRRAAEWLGLSADGIGQHCPFLRATGGCADCVATRTFDSGKLQETERSVTAAGGGARCFRHVASPVRDREGHTIQVVELVEDITVRNALEAKALHAGKLSVLGQMAAGIAHEIGNPLASLSTRVDLLERRQDPHFLRESLGVLRGQIDRIGRIVHGISLFARNRGRKWTVWEVNGAIEEAANIVSLDRRAEAVAFRRRLAEPSPRVRGVRDQIVQVFLNLLLNAVEAMPEGGEVLIEASQLDGEVRVAICDTGMGLSPEVRARLFEPFFTTKPDGTGLGLSISYSFVHAHGGHIEVNSEKGRGSCFLVVLPSAEASTGSPDAAEVRA